MYLKMKTLYTQMSKNGMEVVNYGTNKAISHAWDHQQRSSPKVRK